MAKIESVFTDKAPKPLPQFSQAVKFNGMVYCSGNIGIDPQTSATVEGTVKDRTVSTCSAACLQYAHHELTTTSVQRQALKNLQAVLEQAGSSINNVVKVNVFITTMDHFAAMNEAYDEFFVSDPKPVGGPLLSSPTTTTHTQTDRRVQCRTCVAVKQLPFNTDVEIECTAYVEQS